MRLPGEANTSEVATVGEALYACLSAAGRIQSATRGSPRPQLFDARLTVLANFLKDVGLHALGERALKQLPSVRHFLVEEARLLQPSASERLFASMRGLRGLDDEEVQANVETQSVQKEDPEQSERDAAQLVMSLSALSSSMVSRFYAQTYVQANDTESGEALGLADAAVQICREHLAGNGSLLVRVAPACIWTFIILHM